MMVIQKFAERWNLVLLLTWVNFYTKQNILLKKNKGEHMHFKLELLYISGSNVVAGYKLVIICIAFLHFILQLHFTKSNALHHKLRKKVVSPVFSQLLARHWFGILRCKKKKKNVSKSRKIKYNQKKIHNNFLRVIRFLFP